MTTHRNHAGGMSRAPYATASAGWTRPYPGEYRDGSSRGTGLGPAVGLGLGSASPYGMSDAAIVVGAPPVGTPHALSSASPAARAVAATGRPRVTAPPRAARG